MKLTWCKKAGKCYRHKPWNTCTRGGKKTYYYFTYKFRWQKKLSHAYAYYMNPNRIFIHRKKRLYYSSKTEWGKKDLLLRTHSIVHKNSLGPHSINYPSLTIWVIIKKWSIIILKVVMVYHKRKTSFDRQLHLFLLIFFGLH